MEAFSAAIFRRGPKVELFADGDGSVPVEELELQAKLYELYNIWALSASGSSVSAGIWRPQQRLVEIVLRRGRLFAHMGFTQGSTLHLHIEEAVYLMDRANLMLFIEHGCGEKRLLSLHEVHELMVSCGVSMDHYLVYCKLMRAGYIVQRHPSCWSLKPSMDAQSVWPHWYGGADQRQAGSCSVSLALPAKLSRAHCTSSEESAAAAWVGLVSSTERSCLEVSGLPRCTDASPGCVAPNGTVLTPCAYPKMMPLTMLRAKTQCVEGKAKPGAAALLGLDVYVANNNFSRKVPGKPLFRVVVCNGTSPPSLHHMAAADLAADGVPVRYASVERGDIAFYAVPDMQLHCIFRPTLTCNKEIGTE